LNDGTQVHFFGRDQREAFVQIEAHLMAKDAFGACSCAISFGYAMGIDVLHEIFVLTANGTHEGHSVKN
jgi:hypothetical protein